MSVPSRAETERWLLRRGVPHLIEDYNARERIWTRARPFLIVIVLLQTMLAFNNRFDGVEQGAMMAVALLLLVGSLAVFNRLYRRRLFDVPREVNTPELVFFVVAPALIALLLSEDRLTIAVGVVALNTALLAVTYFVVGFGLLPMLRWAAGKLVEHVQVLVRLTARTLPVLLIITVFMFINAEIWQIAALTTGPSFLVVASAIVSAGLLFLWITSAQFVGRIRQPVSWEEALERSHDTPLARLAVPTEPLWTNPLGRGVRDNLRILLITSVVIQVALVAALVTIFYSGMGMVFVTSDVLDAWVGTTDHEPFLETGIGDLELYLTRVHLRVAGLVGAIAGLNVAVSALTDDAYRDTFTADLVDEMEQNLAVRALYQSLPEDD